MKTVRSNTNLVDIARLRVHGRRVQGGYLVTNELEIFGAINAGEIVLQNLIVDDGSSLEFEANLDFDTLAAEPPISVPGLTSTMVEHPPAQDFLCPASQTHRRIPTMTSTVASGLWMASSARVPMSFRREPT